MKQITFYNRTFNTISSSYASLSNRYRRVTVRFVNEKGGLMSGTFTVGTQKSKKYD